MDIGKLEFICGLGFGDWDLTVHLLIDGYNLLYADRVLTHLNSAELQVERDRLLDQLSAYRRLKSMEITVVFDGWQGGWTTEKREKRKGIEVVFSRLGEKADEVIKRFLREKGAATMVISSDREIMKYAEKMAAPAVSSIQFREKMESALTRRGENLEDEEDPRGEKQKGPSRRPSKREKRRRAALKKL